ncbi:MAG: hypothetical protein KGL44_10060 [Sphingomonadales bacterium]|nr:hypothetical protein [Sphingomonadales bacterium]
MSRPARPVVIILLALLACLWAAPRAEAAQRSAPAWWDPDGVGSGSDWHYRIPVTLPAASTVNSTARVDIDFAAAMVQLGISGTFDANSVRVVRPNRTLAVVQEYNDSIYAGATDAVATRGEVRWIVEDGGAVTYYVYFDVIQNGAKAASGQTPVNGNFEHAATGTQLPAGWASAVTSNALYDAQVRPSESVSVTSDGNPLNNPQTTDGTPKTGAFSYLLGARTNNEPANAGAAQTNSAVLTRTITVPASSPGNLVVNWRAEGWDSENYDNLFVRITTSGGAVTEVVGNSLASYTTLPNSPNIGGTLVSTTAAGYGQYNGFDTTSSGSHTAAMTVPQHAERWWSRTYSLAAFAGQTVTLSIGTNSTELYRSWYHVDDIEWSVVAGTAGSAEGFGVAVTSPLGSLAPGQTVRVLAAVDAKPAAASNPVTADIYLPGGGVFATGVILYNDGTHGDGSANDDVWGSVPFTIPLNTASSTGWLVRAFARDATTTTTAAGATANGLVHRSAAGTTLDMASWWNVDEVTFSVDAAAISVVKTSSVIADGVNSANFMAIPGATVRYCVTIGNAGTATAISVTGSDTNPANLSYIAGTLKSGPSCAGATTTEDDDATGADESDPTGASFAAGTITIARPSLAPSTAFAVTYDVRIN